MSVFLQKYQVKKILGKGVYGEVLLVQDTKGTLFAVKSISKKYLVSEPHLLEHFESLRFCNRKNRYLVNVIQTQEDQNYVYLISEHCEGGDLLNLQRKQENQTFNLKDATLILSQVIDGLLQLHKMGFIHQSINSTNILSKKNQAGINMYKLNNFWLIRRKWKIGSCLPLLGEQQYWAPEIFNGNQYDSQIDVWSFGILFYFMLNKEFPFHLNPYMKLQQMGEEVTKQSSNFSYTECVKKSEKKLIENCTPQVQDLFRKIFESNPKKRITFQQIREHQLFEEYFKNQQFAKLPLLSESNIKIVDPAQQLTKKQQIQQREECSSSIKNQEIQMEQPYKVTLEKEILELELERIGFLFQSEIELVNNINFLPNEKVLVFSYNLRKYYAILLKQFIDKLKPEIYNQKYKKQYPNLNWIYFFQSKQFQTIKKECENAFQQAEIKIQQSKTLCKASLPAIRLFNPQIESILEKEISQSTFDSHFKISYRISTSSIYQKMRQIYIHNDYFMYLILLTFICHAFNKIVEAKEDKLRKIFQELALENKNQSKMIDFGQLRTQLKNLKRKQLKRIFKNLLEAYF